MSYGPSRGRRCAAWSACALAVLIVSFSASAEELQLTVGAKVWANEWTSWTPVPITGTIDLIQSISSDTHFSVIPQASLRYGNWLAAGSYFTDTNYSLGGYVNPSSGQLSSLSPSREEIDGNVGYYVLPGLALTVGYKQIQQDFHTANQAQLYKWTGPTLGAASSASLWGPLGMYGTFAYGRLDLHASVTDAGGNTRFNADYFLAELGFSCGMNTGMSRLSISATLGYRVQVVSTREFDVGTGFGGYRPVDLHDITQGPAISLLARF
jgi:hypothetical protein